MIDYRAGEWGFHVAFGWHGSLAPRALTMAIPNAVITFVVAYWLLDTDEFDSDTSKTAQLVVGTGSSVMLFILYNRSRTSYNRWWEGGTLLQKSRGEWFNAYSSIMAFTSTKPELQAEVDAYIHFVARLMSLLMCCALQQVSPNRDRPFEIIGLEGMEPASMEFLNSAPDKVEIILQWIQRSMVLHMGTGVLPVAPPILSRAFQEVSRGIVNLQNARKIADFPYPYPLAQVSMLLQIFHWAMTPIASAIAFPQPLVASLLSFISIFVLWCIHFNALDLEFPYGNRVNDLPMNSFQQEWNKSVATLVQRMAQRPPLFSYDPTIHDALPVQMSDASDLYIPQPSPNKSNRMSMSTIAIQDSNKRKETIAKTKKQPPPAANNELPLSSTSSNMVATDSSIGISIDTQNLAPPQKDQQRESESGTPSATALEESKTGRGTLNHDLGVRDELRKRDKALNHDLGLRDELRKRDEDGILNHGLGVQANRSGERPTPSERTVFGPVKDAPSPLNNLFQSDSSEGCRSSQGMADTPAIDTLVSNDASTPRGHSSTNSQGSPRHRSKGALLQPQRIKPLILVAGSNGTSSSGESNKQLEEI